jgi:hypothetical protein
MIALFLYKADLNGIGFGANPFEPTVLGLPTVEFSNDLVNFGVLMPFGWGTSGGVAVVGRGIKR